MHLFFLGTIITNANTTLIISSANRERTGNYQCMANNSLGQTESNTIQIDILCK